MPEPLPNLANIADKLLIGKYHRHVFLCIGDSCCTSEVGREAWEALKKELKERNLSLADGPAACYRTKVQCLRVCTGGHLTPAGRHVEISDLPLNIHPLKDGRHALVTTNGFNRHDVSLVDLQSGTVVASERARQSWFGLAVSSTEDRLWWSGGGNGF